VAISKDLLRQAQKIIDEHSGSQIIVYTQLYPNVLGNFCGNNGEMINNNDLLVTFKIMTK
jgi:hypothetical protein